MQLPSLPSFNILLATENVLHLKVFSDMKIGLGISWHKQKKTLWPWYEQKYTILIIFFYSV